MFRWASGGKGYIWLCLPYISEDRLRNQTLWWGDVRPTIEYCLRTVRRVCRDYGGDESRLILAGFSRGAIACNYLGLHTPEIARLWRAFVCYSHYDGVRTTWPFPGAADRTAALERLGRLRGRPQFICHERSVEETRDYLRATGVEGRFEYHDLPFRNHNDAWTLRNIPLRLALRNWLTNV
jgi:predicted esterase